MYMVVLDYSIVKHLLGMYSTAVQYIYMYMYTHVHSTCTVCMYIAFTCILSYMYM